MNVYKKMILDSKKDSDILFEKNLIYITFGTLILSLSICKDIININQSNYNWILIGCLIALTISLLINLFSHMYSSHAHNKILDRNGDINKLNKNIHIMNILAFIFFGIGIISLIFYCVSYCVLNK